ncbi:barstar family protein [Streptomyces sp. NPDC048290]|uniref:barstar family protein n=1 Tax=Streptomyces sp. NPDC048290 TaxID=3155811 RepID=UPI0034445ADE
MTATPSPSTTQEPPKYTLLSYDQKAEYEDLPGYEEPWGTCTDVTGLLTDEPPPPARETYELLGCSLEGALADAVTRARTGLWAPLGPLTLDVLDRHETPVGEWYLEEVLVLDARPCARDLSLTDITVEGWTPEDNPYDYPQCPPLSPGYRTRSEAGTPYGTCRDLAHIRPPRTGPPLVHLLGCSPRGALRSAVRGATKLGEAKVLRVDTSGRPIQLAAEGPLLSCTSSAHGPDLVDLTLAPWGERPPRAAEQVWHLWSEGRPASAGRWSDCTPAAREYWLTTALRNHSHHRPDRPADTTYHLDGRHITDEPGFFCALGEAVNGPGGYFGWGLDALRDCLSGRWGAARGFTLVWHDSAVARTCLGVPPYAHPRTATFEELLAFLTDHGVRLHLA